eukprot:6012350-Lingulodinium_polyedra.AAC.1
MSMLQASEQRCFYLWLSFHPWDLDERDPMFKYLVDNHNVYYRCLSKDFVYGKFSALFLITSDPSHGALVELDNSAMDFEWPDSEPRAADLRGLWACS